MKKQKFDAEICVRRDRDGGVDYVVIVGTPRNLDNIDASDGDQIAVYSLLRVQTYRVNPRLEK